MGRPCCGVRHCTGELQSTQDKFCPAHWGYKELCAIEDCGANHEPGFKTCTNPNHRKLEDWYHLHDKASFTLRRRLQRARVSHPNEAVAPNAPVDEVFEVAVDDHDTIVPGSSSTADTAQTVTSETVPQAVPDPSSIPTLSTGSTPSQSVPSSVPPVLNAPCPDKPPAGNRRLRAAFGRRRTHNEEVMTRPCGVILLRETFYGSETVPQVLVCSTLFWVWGAVFTDSMS